MFKVPEGVSDKAAVTVEPLAVIVHALHMVDFQARETAVVIGAGPIGILTGIALLACGAEKVYISDIFRETSGTGQRAWNDSCQPEQGEPEGYRSGRN